ncbi:hypothetical protein [Virgibacillus halodenitrificans]|uniref:hypothetical protein n=1 Tax=Virgibacillus halodenitrificans TaxID=1482 RepID=UPI001F40E2B5|nr:hypothetical protein [Virgibacillus halodenitrificans]
MSNNKDVGDFSNYAVDMLVDSILKKHGARLEPDKIKPKEKEQLKNLVDNLKKSVEGLSENKKDKKD